MTWFIDKNGFQTENKITQVFFKCLFCSISWFLRKLKSFSSVCFVHFLGFCEDAQILQFIALSVQWGPQILVFTVFSVQETDTSSLLYFPTSFCKRISCFVAFQTRVVRFWFGSCSHEHAVAHMKIDSSVRDNSEALRPWASYILFRAKSWWRFSMGRSLFTPIGYRMQFWSEGPQ